MAKEVLELEVQSNLGDVVKQTEKLDGATKKGAKGFKGIGTAVKGVGLALKAAGIGLIVALLAKLMEVFSSNQKVLNTFNTTMTALSIAFNDLFSYLDENYAVIKGYLKGIFTDPLGEMAKLGLGIEKFFIEKMKGASMVLKGVATIMANITNPKKMLEGLAQISAGTVIAGKEIADIYADIEGSVSDYVSSVTDQAKGITALTNAALLAEVQFAKLNAEYLRDAEIQRQIRDDVSKTFAVRIAANEELSKVLARQSADQEVQLQIQLDAAKQKLAVNKENIDLQIAAGQAENAMAELKETITGQESEQLNNKIALEEELRVGREQSLAEGMSGQERELSELKSAYEEKKRLAIKSGVETAAITKTYEKQKSQVVAAGVSAQLGAYSSLTGALGKLAGDNKELAVATAVMDTYAAANSVLKDPTLVGPARWASAAAVIVTGLANVSSIMNTQVPGGGGGGGGSAPAAPAPQMMSGAFDISGGVAPEPVKAFVLTDEMSNSQNQLANIRRRATI